MSEMAHKRKEAPHGLVCPARGLQYATKSTGWLKCGWKQRLRIGRSSDWWTTLKVAQVSLARPPADQRGEESEADDPEAEEPQAEMSSEDEDFVDLPAECDLAGNEAEAEVVENDFADLLAELDLAGAEVGDGFANFLLRTNSWSRRPRISSGIGAEAETADYSAALPVPADPEHINMLVRQQKDEEGRQQQFQQQDDALPADEGAHEIAIWDKALFRNHVTSISGIRVLQKDRTIRWTPGSNEIAYSADDVTGMVGNRLKGSRYSRTEGRWTETRTGAETRSGGGTRGATHKVQDPHWDRDIQIDIAKAPYMVHMIAFDAVCVASEFAHSLTSLLDYRYAKHPLVLFLRGQSGSGKTWLTRKLLELLDGADISIISFAGGMATRTIPQPDNKHCTVKLTKRRLDVRAKWLRTAKTAAKESPSRTVVFYRMDSFLLIDMPGNELVGNRPEETRMMNTTNMEVLATLDDFHKTGKVSCSIVHSRAVKIISKTLKIPNVHVLVATVLRDTDVSNPKALWPLQG
ncbi:hypothetical protein FN846DRAFT_906108 [Sphaerosporella brunnea]|uniref:AAA+ ATPase domain-containing protein n=1 Tax=Sphaerosporella brunnea TaxID=1250544 RepID=A0A5J5F0D5_9PEZI|nr:hypothetical protein FN846DRAFT_906108 [Sphaerosporella brunnea]